MRSSDHSKSLSYQQLLLALAADVISLRTSLVSWMPSVIQIRSRLLLVCVCGILAVVVGCEEQARVPVPSTLPYQGLSVQVVVPEGWDLKARWAVQIEEWNARTGAQASLVEMKMADETVPLLADKENPQLIVVPWTRRGELLAQQKLMAIPEESLSEVQLDWGGILQGVREKLGETDLGPTFAPLGVPCLVCYYRADLLEKAGLSPPQTWDDYQGLLEKLDSWAPGLVAVEPWSPEFRATLFLARSLPFVLHPGQYSTIFDVTTGDPLIASPGFVRGLELCQQAMSHLSPDSLKSQPEDCRKLFLEGQAALTITLETGAENRPINLGTNVPSGKQAMVGRQGQSIIGTCRLPGSREVYNVTQQAWEETDRQQVNFTTLTGFSGLCAAIPEGTPSAQANAAMSLLGTLLLEPSSVPPAGPRFVCRESQLPEVGTYVGPELTPPEGGRYLSVVARGFRDRQLVSEIPVPGYVQFRKALTGGITEAIQGGKSALEALKDVEKLWKMQLQQQGQAETLNCYRSVLGLGRKEAIRSLDEE